MVWSCLKENRANGGQIVFWRSSSMVEMHCLLTLLVVPGWYPHQWGQKNPFMITCHHHHHHKIIKRLETQRRGNMCSWWILISQSVSTHSHLCCVRAPARPKLSAVSTCPEYFSTCFSLIFLWYFAFNFPISSHLVQILCPQPVLSYKRWGQGAVSASDRFVPARSGQKYAPSNHFRAASSQTHLGMTSPADSTCYWKYTCPSISSEFTKQNLRNGSANFTFMCWCPRIRAFSSVGGQSFKRWPMTKNQNTKQAVDKITSRQLSSSFSNIRKF